MKQKTRTTLVDFLLLVLCAAVLYFLLQKTFFLIFPIFLAYLFSEGIRKSLNRLKPLSPTAKQILTVLVLLIFFSLLSLVAVLLTERIVHFSTMAAEVLSDHINDIVSFCKDKIRSLENTVSRIININLENRFTLYLPELFQKFLQKGLELIPKWMGQVVSFFPRFFISLIIFLVSCYYFSCDWERVSAYLTRKIAAKKRETLLLGKKHFFQSLKQYTRAYFLLFLLSFAQLFLGLTLMRIRGAFGISLLIAFVDLLPVLGCGTVLIPWSLISFLSGNTGLGAGLLVLYLITLLVHQFAEPKIVGSSIGLHPLLSLILVIAGLRFFGFFGMILFPLLCTCVLKVHREMASIKTVETATSVP